jgi:hypothetical protein
MITTWATHKIGKRKKRRKKNTCSSLQKGVVKRNVPKKKKKTLDVVLSYLGNRLYTMSPKYSMFPKPLYFPLWAVAKISFTSKRGFFDWDVKIRPVVWWGLGQFYHCWAVITNTNSASVVIKVVLKIFNTPALYQFWYTSVLRFLGFRGNLRFRLPQNPRDRFQFWFRLWIF